ncbi:hypothetical protein X777_08713 [Ooceraea biroi]|uniref:Histone-lysine N-methyltransferase SETMAR n=1 Tax=Ooceraea biroi TaxID=2015173 RepID=A0A026W811_OOCBI|nr:hypothetical protein X777_08713 [Ooceraea biroi]
MFLRCLQVEPRCSVPSLIYLGPCTIPLTPLLVRDFLAKNSTNTIPQAPYSPDIVPCDFFLFP